MITAAEGTLLDTGVVIKPSRIKNEYTAICGIMDRHDNSHGIPLFLADRGFPSYNCFAHAKEKNAAFLIRAKDDYVTRLLRGDKPDSDEFDLSVDRIIVRHKRKKQYLHPEHGDRYRYVDANTSFDFIEHGKQDEYGLHLRVVRIKIKDGVYENLITNLSPEEFYANDLKELYRLRWGEEISFRELKHILGAADFHSKIVEYVTHELWARLLLYNFCSQITRLAVTNKKDRKHMYQVNFAMAYQTCREFLRRNTQLGHFVISSRKRCAPPDILCSNKTKGAGTMAAMYIKAKTLKEISLYRIRKLQNMILFLA